MQVKSLSAQLDKTRSSNLEQQRSTAAVAAISNVSSTNDSVAEPKLFTPRKSVIAFTAVNAALNMMHSVSHSNATSLANQRSAPEGNESSTSRPQLFQPIASTSSLVASVRSHVSTRPSVLLASPPVTSFMAPAAPAPEASLSYPQSRHFQPREMRRDAPPSLRDSYSQDAEMWGECVSPLPPPSHHALAEPVPRSNTAPASESVADVQMDAFDLVSPGGDVVQRSQFANPLPYRDHRRQNAELHWLSAAVNDGRGQQRGPSPETIALKEATAVRTAR